MKATYYTTAEVKDDSPDAKDGAATTRTKSLYFVGKVDEPKREADEKRDGKRDEAC